VQLTVATSYTQKQGYDNPTRAGLYIFVEHKCVCIFLRPGHSQWRLGSCWLAAAFAELTSRVAAYMYSLELDRDSAEHSVPAAVSPPPDTQNLLSNRTQGCHQLTMSKVGDHAFFLFRFISEFLPIHEPFVLNACVVNQLLIAEDSDQSRPRWPKMQE